MPVSVQIANVVENICFLIETLNRKITDISFLLTAVIIIVEKSRKI